MDRFGKVIVVVPWIIAILVVGGVGFAIGSSYQKEDREELAHAAGMREEADAVQQDVLWELESAKKDENGAHSVRERAEAQGRIDALKAIEYAIDEDKTTLWNYSESLRE